MNENDIKTFSKFLIDNDALHAYETNILNGDICNGGCCTIHHETYNLSSFLRYIKCRKESVIDMTLSWNHTPEGHSYWSRLNSAWASECIELRRKPKKYKSIW